LNTITGGTASTAIMSAGVTESQFGAKSKPEKRVEAVRSGGSATAMMGANATSSQLAAKSKL